MRRIYSFETEPMPDNEGVYRCVIKGSAFLWHQVRMMMAVLFLVAKGAEKPVIVDLLLDINSVEKKPLIHMAPPENLLLSDCGFEDVSPSMWEHEYGG